MTHAQELMCYRASAEVNVEPCTRWTAVLVHLVGAFKTEADLVRADALQLALVSLLSKLVQVSTASLGCLRGR